MGDVKENLASNIKYLRKKQGISQQTMADDFECSNTAISNWEVGCRTPEAIYLPKLANYFGVSIDDLLTKDLKNEDIHTSNKDKVILDNVRLLSDDEKEKVLSMIDIIRK